MKKFSLALLTLFLALVLGGFFVSVRETQAPFGAPFSLVNQDNQPVTEKTYAGRFRLLYFGFTYCPAICPTELKKLADVLKGLGPQAKSIVPIFITVDPERDTPALLKSYLSLFDSRFIGLTGEKEDIERILPSYKAFARKIFDEDGEDYTMEHSTYIYFIGPKGDLLHLFPMKEDAKKITLFLKEYLETGDSPPLARLE